MDEAAIEARLARIEEKQDTMKQSIDGLDNKYDGIIRQLLEAVGKIAVVDNKAASAHHRIDDLKRDICWTLGVSVTVVGIFASILTSILR